MILSFLFFTLLAYLLFRVVFDFVIPIYKTTKKVKRTFREMNERMNQQQNGAAAHQQTTSEPVNKKSTLGEYI
ncbi:MAG: hypothetical protein EOO46_22905, partial [Flavobacterium sp.]